MHASGTMCGLDGHGNQLLRLLDAVMHDSQNRPAKLNETAAQH